MSAQAHAIGLCSVRRIIEEGEKERRNACMASLCLDLSKL